MTISPERLRRIGQVSREEAQKAYQISSVMPMKVERNSIWWTGRVLDGQALIFNALADLLEDKDDSA